MMDAKLAEKFPGLLMDPDWRASAEVQALAPNAVPHYIDGIDVLRMSEPLARRVMTGHEAALPGDLLLLEYSYWGLSNNPEAGEAAGELLWMREALLIAQRDLPNEPTFSPYGCDGAIDADLIDEQSVPVLTGAPDLSGVPGDVVVSYCDWLNANRDIALHWFAAPSFHVNAVAPAVREAVQRLLRGNKKKATK